MSLNYLNLHEIDVMNRSVFRKHVWPFAQWFTLMILITIIIDYFLHRYELVYIGRWFGLAGTITIMLSFIYSARKRKLITSGSPKSYLKYHEYFSWVGSILILVHAGIHFNALLPWLAILMLIISVASGLTGKFLLKKSNETYKTKLQALIDSGTAPDEAEKKLFFDSITVDIMRTWRKVHMPITLLLMVLSLIHIITIVMFSL